MATTNHFDFTLMPEQYRRDVEDKIAALQAVAEEIHRHLKGICERGARYEISPTFRLKTKNRIMEKDLKDYDGRVYNECLRTQVKDIFAARLWPSNNYMIDRDLEVVKMEIVIELLECFAHLKLKCVFAQKIVSIGDREIKVKYFTINGHIELQIDRNRRDL